MAHRARAFGMTIQYHNRSRLAAELEGGAKYVGFDELLSSSDVFSLNLALNPATRHIIGATELGKMKDGVVIVNTARGALIDEKALVAAIESGKVRIPLILSCVRCVRSDRLGCIRRPRRVRERAADRAGPAPERQGLSAAAYWHDDVGDAEGDGAASAGESAGGGGTGGVSYADTRAEVARLEDKLKIIKRIKKE
jgi:D-isomer specific 2-hydroxyacid dehydrogenase, NAD binding domain